MCCMINFIICDDKKEFRNEIINTIDAVMLKNNEAYKVHPYSEYNEEFLSVINNDLSLKIYILDIEVKDKSGIDVARKIREKYIESMIVFITSYYEKYIQDILKSKFISIFPPILVLLLL